jgi:hypothetical protein
MKDFDEVYMERMARLIYPGDVAAQDAGQEAATEQMSMEQAMQQATVGTLPQVQQDGQGSIQEIPRNAFQQALGKFGETLTSAGVQLDKVGIDIPALGRVTLKDLTIGDMGKVIEDMSYGFMPTRGAGGIGGTSGLKPEAAELLNLPIVGTAARATGTVAAAGAKFVAPKVGEMLDSYMRRTGMTMDLMAYHGTPHRFPAEEGAPLGRFRSEKIGTGEGAQVYGYGLYFAESPSVAGQYKISTSANQYETTNGMVRSQDLADEILKNVGQVDRQLQAALYSKANLVVRDLIMGSSPDSIVKAIRESKYANMYKGIADSVEALNPTKAKGNFYTVDIPDEMIGKMLDWDKPLSEQSKEIQQLAKQYGLADPDHMGGDLIAAVKAKRPEGAKILSDAGIPGVRYLDQGSRGAVDGTRNIVVFPGGENQIKIVKVE